MMFSCWSTCPPSTTLDQMKISLRQGILKKMLTQGCSTLAHGPRRCTNITPSLCQHFLVFPGSLLETATRCSNQFCRHRLELESRSVIINTSRYHVDSLTRQITMYHTQQPLKINVLDGGPHLHAHRLVR